MKKKETNSPYSPGVLTLLPLYYIGWADSLLSPSEVKLIQNKIAQLPFLEKEDIDLLNEWSNPAKPPSRELFRQWVKLIRNTTKEMAPGSFTSMANLGMEMARQSANQDKTLDWSSNQTKAALEELEQAIGGADPDTIKSIFSYQEKEEEQAPFDVDALTRLLDDDYKEVRDRMRALLSDPEFALALHSNKDAQREHVMYWCQELANQGLGALAFPEAYGGKNDMGNYAAVFEMLGYHDISLTIKFGVQFGLFGGSIQRLGTEKHHEKYLKEVGTLQLPGCFAMTELGHGSNVRGLETTATYHHHDQTIVIHTPTTSAGKDYIGNAAKHGRMATVFAQLIVEGQSHGVHAILVPIRSKDNEIMPGVRIEDCGYKLGLNGVDNGRIWFDQVKVPKENLLNKFGDIDSNGQYISQIANPSRRFFTMLGTLVGGRVCVPQAGLSAAKTGLTIAIKYALKRRQFAPSDGEPETLLLDYPTHQRRLMPRLATAYALDIALTYLTKRYVNQTDADSREIETLAAGLKSYATWFTTSTLQECREACGGKGYLAENRLAELKADTDIFTTFEGDNTVLMQLVAKGLLGTFKASLHDEGFMAIAKIITERVSTTISERNPITIRKTDSGHLLDSEFQLAAFYYRERTILLSLTQRMQRLLSKTRDPNKAFLRCQTHMVELANAFIEHVILKQFVLAFDRVEPSVKPVLKNLCDLYALSTIEKHKGWYLENGYMEGGKTKAVRRMVDKLCKETRKNAGYLVDAFAIPQECLSAPIARDK